jgi:hypothetical protein
MKKLALLACLPAVRAEQDLRDGVGASLPGEEYYALVELATGSKSAAEKALRERVKAQQRAGITPT